MLDRQTQRQDYRNQTEGTYKESAVWPAKKSHIAEYNIDTEHSMIFNHTCRLDKVAGYVDLMVKEVTEIQLNLYIFQQGLGLHGNLNLAACT